MKRAGKWMALGIALAGVSVCCLAAAGQDEQTDEEKAFLELGTARAKVEYVVRASGKLMDENQSGWRLTYDSIQHTVGDAQGVLNRGEHEERQKPHEEQDQAFLNECQSMRYDLGRTWSEFEIKVRRPLQQKYYNARNGYGEVTVVLPRLLDLERHWNFDPALLTPLYKAMNVRAREAKALAEEAHAGLKKAAKDWEDKLKAAEAYVGTRGE